MIRNHNTIKTNTTQIVRLVRIITNLIKINNLSSNYKNSIIKTVNPQLFHKIHNKINRKIKIFIISTLIQIAIAN